MKNFAYLKKELLVVIYRLMIIAIAVIGILAPSQNTFLGQFWFFTLQTNLFVIFIMLALILAQVLSIFKLGNFVNSKTFNYFRIASTFYITITGFIYCFVLAPVAIITNSPLVTAVSYRDILLHIFVPVMTIFEYYLFGQKVKLKNSDAILFLIYPIIYASTIFVRAIFSNQTFPGGSLYPYFFIDPTFNNQGWLAVFYYLAICLIFFFLLGLLYIYINNKLTKNNDNALIKKKDIL